MILCVFMHNTSLPDWIQVHAPRECSDLQSWVQPGMLCNHARLRPGCTMHDHSLGCKQTSLFGIATCATCIAPSVGFVNWWIYQNRPTTDVHCLLAHGKCDKTFLGQECLPQKALYDCCRKKEKKEKKNAFQHQFNEKPSIIAVGHTLSFFFFC